MRPRTAIHQITGAKQAIRRRREADRIKCGLQSLKTSMDITHREIATQAISFEAKKLRTEQVARVCHWAAS